MSAITERIATIDGKMEKLKAQRLALAQKEKALLNRRSRKDETRKKILRGAAVLEMIEKGSIDAEKFHAFLDGFLTRKTDRLLFGFYVETKAVKK
ncbi:MAG: mobilization protein [Burkholderiales bacterium]|jgi:large subunit ribosomal protein L7/L12|nr:mobilization protein [Burkholderiales bacterium]